MSKNRMINTKFWSDSFVVDKLNALDRYLFLYLLTNEHTNIIGIYELSMRTAAFETGIEKEDLVRMINRLSPKVEYIDGWIYIPSFVEHQQLNPNIIKGMKREAFALPDKVLKFIFDRGEMSERLIEVFKELENSFKESESLSKPSKESVKPELKLEPELKLKLKPYGNNKDDDEPSSNVSVKPVKAAPVKTEDIDNLFSLWESTVGYAVTSQVKTNREYAAKLIREYPPGHIEAMLKGVAMSLEDRYAPRISNFAQLYRKWDDLKAWGRRQSGNGNGKPRIGVV